MSSLVGPDEDNPLGKPPVPEEVQEAIRTLLRWTGDDPSREGLLDTPKRVARAWKASSWDLSLTAFQVRPSRETRSL